MEVTGSAEPAEMGSGVADQPEDDPVQEVGHDGAAAHSGPDSTESTSHEVAAVGSGPLGVESEEKEQADRCTETNSTQLLDHGDIVMRFDQELEAAQTEEAADAADSELSAADLAELEQAVAESAAEPEPPSRHLNQVVLGQAESDHDQAEPVAAGVLLAEGARPLLQEEDLQAAAYPFMQWLASPCMTATEALVKAKRVKSTSQLTPIKNTLKFIFALLYESKAMDTIDLKALLQLSVVQALYQTLVNRQVGSGRMHQIFLLVKKMLVFLSSAESVKTRQFVQPTAYESYLYVENICSESSNQRKQEARNRMVLGIHGARGALAQPKEVFEIPKTWSGGTVLNRAAPAITTPLRPVGKAAPVPQQHLTAAVAEAPTCSPNQTMTKEELSSVTQACLAYLSDTASMEAADSASDWNFTHYLITGTLCLGLAPRSQVLQQLRIGSSFTKEADGLYWIRMRAEQSKNGRPTLFALASQLTPAYDHYLQSVRPRMLARSAADAAAQHDYVFFKRSGAAPRMDFSSSTCLVTQQVLGRPVNAHTFRSSLVTIFFSSGATEAEMSMLASIMAHDPATQRNFYYKPKHSQGAQQASQRMVSQLLPGPHAFSMVDPDQLEDMVF